jgi:capsular exopolysaccharide synthesis family protein
VSELELESDDDFLGLAELEDPADRAAARSEIDPVNRLRSAVVVDATRDSMTLKIHVSDTDPDRAVIIADEVARQYIKYQNKQRSATTGEASKWLEEQMAVLRVQLATSEENIIEFRRANTFLGTSLEDSLNLTSETILDLNEALTQTSIEYLSLNSRYDRAQELAAVGDYGSIPEVLDDMTIDRLKQQRFEFSAMEAEHRARYGELNPRLQRLEAQREQIDADLDREIHNILTGMDVELRNLRDSSVQLQAELEHQRELAFDLKQKELEYSRLERDLMQTEQLYTQVHDRLLQAELQAELASKENSGSISILDRATRPGVPYKPRLKVILIGAVLLGLVLAVGAVFAVDRLDTTVRDSSQVEVEHRLPVLGILPRLESGDRETELKEGELPLAIARNPKGSAAESCRTIRTNLMFMSPGREIHTLLVTSAGPGEGKTSVAANLAYTTASSGKRVILVDTDMRRPRVHQVFRLARVGALTDVLIGEADLQKAIVPSGLPNLDLMPLGSLPPNPAELIDSLAFHNLIEQLKSKYDKIILDSPPVMAVTDAAILAQYADAVLLVVRQGRTNRHVLRGAMRMLKTVNANVVGFVLNDVDLTMAARGYYQYRYSYKYPNYYYTYQYSSRYSDENEEAEGSSGSGT